MTISVETDRDRYIAFEPIFVTVTLKNRSGHSLYFGDDNEEQGYLLFHIKNLNGTPVVQIDKDINPIRSLTLPAGGTKMIKVPVSNYFAVQDDDDYQLAVRVGHKRLINDFLSKPTVFQVRRGVSVWESLIGVPDHQSTGKIKTRKCSLNIFHQSNGDLYYLQIDDNDLVYTVARLGPRVMGINPRCDIDALSRIHTLIQTAPRLFNYRVFDYNGQLKLNSVYLIGQNVPQLIRDPDVGRVMVRGGRIGLEGVDYNKKTGENGEFIEPIQNLPPSLLDNRAFGK